MGPRSILIIGNYGAGNLGDDAILAGIVTELRSLGHLGEIQVTNGGINSSPEVYKGLKKVPFIPVGLRARFKKNRHEAVAALKRADLVILGGGGLFTDEESWKAPLIWYGQAKACQKMNKPYICYGQSVGPLRHWWSRQLCKRVFKWAKAVQVRDQKSLVQLKNLGLEARVGTDPAFSWLLEEKRSIPRKAVLLVSLRRWPGLPDLKPLIKEVQVYAKHKKLKPILITMDTRENLETYGLEVYRPHSAREAFEAFEKATLSVTMRLHAGIFSVAAGTPTLVLSYTNKVEGLLGNYCHVLKDWSPSSFREELKNTKKPNGNLEQGLSQNQAFLREILTF